MWSREPGFPTLVRIILEQQVSLASARAAYQKLLELVSPLNPEGFLGIDDRKLREAGFSRQKAGYCRSLAESIVRGEVDLDRLQTVDDSAARSALLEIRGVGPWTADIYLLMALGRPDVWPGGDLALATAAREVKRLRRPPGPAKLEALGGSWRPWRAVAARLLWHHYLSRPARNGGRAEREEGGRRRSGRNRTRRKPGSEASA
jgi:DNA-3-methyladenine glycosylase II